MRDTVTVLGKDTLIQEGNLYSFMYKSLEWRTKMNKNIDVNFLKMHTISTELFYYPMWIAKILLIAERKPFPAKKIPNMIFVDAISGYRGLFSSIPVMVEKNVDSSKLVDNTINNLERAKQYIIDVQKKQINRAYVLKKPDYHLEDLFLAYIPIWRVRVEGPSFQRRFFINSNTGESEEYMSKLWENGTWLELG